MNLQSINRLMPRKAAIILVAAMFTLVSAPQAKAHLGDFYTQQQKCRNFMLAWASANGATQVAEYSMDSHVHGDHSRKFLFRVWWGSTSYYYYVKITHEYVIFNSPEPAV